MSRGASAPWQQGAFTPEQEDKMIMKKTINLLLLALLVQLTMSCNEEEKLSPDSVIDAGVIRRDETELSKWIHDNYTRPYGIAVNYRRNKNTAPEGSYTVPPSIDKVEAVLQTLKALWIGLYTDKEFEGGHFLKGKSPITIYLYGGRNTDINGVELPGNSRALPIEMHIYNVNDFDPKDKNKVFLLMRSVHHQYAKRLMEIFPFKRDDFLAISRHRYTYSTKFIADLGTEVSDELYELNEYANTRGFYTLHSFLSAEDDFAEIISCTLLYTPKEIRKAEKRAKTPDYDSDPVVQEMYAKEAEQAHREFMAKQAFVNDYFLKEVKIPLRRLQTISVKKMRSYFSK